MSKPENYGSKYFVVLCEKYEVTLCADRLEVTENGDLVAFGGFRKKLDDKPQETTIIYGFAKNQWLTFYASSGIDGTAVAAFYE